MENSKKKNVFCQDISILVYQVERKDITNKANTEKLSLKFYSELD